MDELREHQIALSVHANVNDRRQAHKKGFVLGTSGSTTGIKKQRHLVGDDYAGKSSLLRLITFLVGA